MNEKSHPDEPVLHEVFLLPSHWRFEVGPDVPVLDAARRSGIRMPKSCRNGTCRNCLCQLVSGSIHYRIEWPGVSAQEKADGVILPCIAYADGPLVIDAPDARPLQPPPAGRRRP